MKHLRFFLAIAVTDLAAGILAVAAIAGVDSMLVHSGYWTFDPAHVIAVLVAFESTIILRNWTAWLGALILQGNNLDPVDPRVPVRFTVEELTVLTWFLGRVYGQQSEWDEGWTPDQLTAFRQMIEYVDREWMRVDPRLREKAIAYWSRTKSEVQTHG